MDNFSKQGGNKTKSNIFIVLLFVLMSNVAVFGQNAVENNDVPSAFLENNVIVSNNNVEINTMKYEAAPNNASSMNFVLWFMGSKQSPNAIIVPAGNTIKKQFMTSGTAPNRLLIKAFLKKAINFETAEV